MVFICDTRATAGHTSAMPDEKRAGSIWDDVWSFEQRLRTGAKRAHGPQATQDLELAGLLQRIARRRRSRAGVPWASPGLPVAVTQPQPSASAAPGSVLAVKRVTSQVAILQLAKPAGFQFQPGQHIKLGLQAGPTNPYTIASAPHEPHLEFCIESVPGGRVSPQLSALPPGARVALGNKASGDFLLVPNVDTHVMLATVTGIGPFRSMLRAAVASGTPSSRFVILHGASFHDELVYQEELQALAQQLPERVRYVPSVSRPSDPRNAGFLGLKGRVADLAPAFIQELRASHPGRLQVYACGHPQMVATAHQALEALGLPVLSEVFD